MSDESSNIIDISTPMRRDMAAWRVRRRTPGTREFEEAKTELFDKNLRKSLKAQEDRQPTTVLSPQMGQVINVDFVNKKRI